MTITDKIISASLLWGDMDKIRQAKPLIHNITNSVVTNLTANALLAVGASPIMSHEETELEELISYASALVINIGTLDRNTIPAMKMAAGLAGTAGKPVVLDPVGAGASKIRTQTSLDLLSSGHVRILRGNAGEIMALAGSSGAVKGVDSLASSTQAEQAGFALATRFNCAVAISGQSDVIISKDYSRYITTGGNKMVTSITGMGCTSTALCAAFAAVNTNMGLAAAHAMQLLKAATETGMQKATGPATLQTGILDSLATISQFDLEQKLQLLA